LETDDDEGDVLLLSLYKKFLIGSKLCEDVKVNTEDQLKTLAQVALTHPMSLQKLREVHNDGCISDKWVYDEDEDQVRMQDFSNTCFKVK
jgi:hypothetical protein